MDLPFYSVERVGCVRLGADPRILREETLRPMRSLLLLHSRPACRDITRRIFTLFLADRSLKGVVLRSIESWSENVARLYWTLVEEGSGHGVADVKEVRTSHWNIEVASDAAAMESASGKVAYPLPPGCSSSTPEKPATIRRRFGNDSTTPLSAPYRWSLT